MDNTTRINHNNSGHKYRIAVDIAKEGSHIWDLTPYFKGRVGDNNFGLQVTWYYQGQLMNVVGMKPYIEGLVGQYSFGKNGEIDMDPDAVPVRYDGSPDDCEEAGKATFYFPSQMFPKEGIFKGFIGVKDDRDGSKNPQISGVTIWFKVLPGIAQMGHACDAYVDELDKALQNFKVKLDQHDKDYQTQLQQVIDDARNAYESETKSAHDSLDALKAQIQANRDEQENLAQHLAGTEQQIEIHDVVTRPEFLDLGNRLNQQVANLRQNKTLYFQNLAELQSQYPNGTDNLCVTLDDKHLHVYDYANGQWTDAGATDVITADPQTKDALYQDSSNLAPDPDFKIVDGEWYTGADLGTANWAFEKETFDNSKVVKLVGYYNQATENNWNNSWWSSRPINIANQKYLSVAWLVNAKSAGQPSDAHTELNINFADADGNTVAKWAYPVPESADDKLHLVKWENLYNFPQEAVAVTIAVLIHGSGEARFCRPMLNFSRKIGLYSHREIQKNLNLKNSSDNLIPDPEFNDLSNWNAGSDNNNIQITTLSNKINNSHVIRLTNTADAKSAWLTSNPFEISNGTISSKAKLNIHMDNPSTSHISLAFTFYDQDFKRIGNSGDNRLAISTVTTSQLQDFKFEYCVVPDGTAYADFYVIITGKGYVDIVCPEANQGETVLPYSIKDEIEHVQLLTSRADWHNLVPNPELTNMDLWNPDSDAGRSYAQLLDSKVNKLSIVRLNGPEAIDGNDSGNAWFTSSNFDISSASKINSSWLLNVNANDPMNFSVLLGISFFDANNNKVGDQRQAISTYSFSNVLTQYIFDNVSVPEGAIKANIYVQTWGKGYVDIAYPQATYNLDDIKSIQLSDNFLCKPTKRNWSLGKDLGGNVSYKINSDSSLSFDGFHSDITENNFNNTWFDSAPLPIKSKAKIISFMINAEAEFKQGTDDNYIRLDFKTFDKTGTHILSAASKMITNNKSNIYYWDGLFLPSDAGYFDIGITLHNQGTVTIKDFDYKFDNLYQDSLLPKIFIKNSDDIDDGKWHKEEFDYINASQKLNGYLQIGVQGDSSRSYPKKNYKIKMFQDADLKNKMKFKPKSNWKANNKFNLKANWIDATQSRNIVNAQLIEKAVRNTPLENIKETGNILTAQGLGQVEGFPVEVYLNDGYHGLYTFNTKKDDKTFGMDSDNPQHEVISVELSDQVFRDPKATIDEKNYLTEIHDAPSANVKSNFEKLVQFINQSTPDDFVKHLGDYIDVKSCINTMLYGILSKEYDYYSKSYLLCTWNDGAYFYMVPYDLDSTWGLYWDGSKIVEDENDLSFSFEELIKDPNINSFISNHMQNRLFERIYEHFKPEVKSQYDLLRSTVWKNSDIIDAFKTFIGQIPEKALEREHQRWTTLPSVKITDFAQIQNFIIKRGNAMDDFMNNHFLTQTDNGNTQPTTPQAQSTEPKQ